MPQYQFSSTYVPPLETFRKSLLRSSIEPYQSADRYARIFAKIKLAIDPAFVTILKHGLIPDDTRLLDLGCGQGLLTSALLAAQSHARKNCWPNDWPAPPTLISIKGVDSVPLDIQRAQLALGRRASFATEDVRTADFGKADVVVILDVLHYIDYPAQEALLRKVRRALPPSGRLILRVGNAAAGAWFKASYWYDRLVWFLRVGKDNPLYCRPLDDWMALLWRLGFDAKQVPMDSGIKLTNTLLVATARDTAEACNKKH